MTEAENWQRCFPLRLITTLAKSKIMTKRRVKAVGEKGEEVKI